MGTPLSVLLALTPTRKPRRREPAAQRKSRRVAPAASSLEPPGVTDGLSVQCWILFRSSITRRSMSQIAKSIRFMSAYVIEKTSSSQFVSPIEEIPPSRRFRVARGRSDPGPFDLLPALPLGAGLWISCYSFGQPWAWVKSLLGVRPADVREHLGGPLALNSHCLYNGSINSVKPVAIHDRKTIKDRSSQFAFGA
jgi:hypothetical protein